MSFLSLNNKSLRLNFPINTGEDEGLNTPGITDFEGEKNIDFLVREAIQNSLDASDTSEAVTITFTFLQQDKNAIPCIKDIENSINSCADFYSKKHPDEENIKDTWIYGAQQILKKDKINILKISDYGTPGLAGDDNTDGTTWYSLVKSIGDSHKNDNSAGGSYGIGKLAPFAVSLLRTVFYSTKTNEGYAFQGVCRFMTHKRVYNNEEYNTRGKGYIGYCNEDNLLKPAHIAVRNYEDIPEYYRRDKKGTDLYIIGSKFDISCIEGIIKALLDNFWLAIEQRKIIVKINSDLIINHENLDDMMNEYANKYSNEFDAFYLYKTYLNPSHTFNTTIPGLGDVELRLKENDIYQNVIMGTRKTGMTHHFFKQIPSIKKYFGIFLCDTDEGNKNLRKMEPVKHNKWHYSHAKNNELQAKIIYDNIRKWIKESIASLQDPNELDDLKINLRNIELVYYDYDIQGEGDLDDFDKEDGVYNEKEQYVSSNNSSSKEDDDSFISGIFKKHIIKTIKGNIKNKDRTRIETKDKEHKRTLTNNEGSVVENLENTDISHNSEKKQKYIIPIKIRSQKLNDGYYKVILRSPITISANIEFYASVESGQSEFVIVQSAFLSDNRLLDVQDGCVMNIELIENKPFVMKLKLDNAVDIALECKGVYYGS